MQPWIGEDGVEVLTPSPDPGYVSVCGPYVISNDLGVTILAFITGHVKPFSEEAELKRSWPPRPGLGDFLTGTWGQTKSVSSSGFRAEKPGSPPLPHRPRDRRQLQTRPGHTAAHPCWGSSRCLGPGSAWQAVKQFH